MKSITMRSVGVLVVIALAVAGVAIFAFQQKEADTQAPLAANTVGSAQIIDNSIQSSDLGGASVTSRNIADKTIEEADLQDGSVTLAKLGSDVSLPNTGSGSELSLSVRVESTSVQVDPRNARNYSAQCDAGEISTAGGYSTNFKDSISVTSSYPSGRNGWVVSVINRGSDPATLDVYAMCMKLDGQ
jgi:hypothetical protein